MNEITYVRTDDGEALYLNGNLYDYANVMNIYDLLGLLENEKVVDKANYIDYKIEPVKFVFPQSLNELKSL